MSAGASTIYDGGAITITGGASNTASGNSNQRTGGAVTISSGDGGGSSGTTARAGDIVLLPGKAVDTAKHGKLILKAADGNAAGEAVVTISSNAAVSKYALTADDIDITSTTDILIHSTTSMSLTTGSGQTMTLGASGGLLVIHNAVIAKLEGGLIVGQTNAASSVGAGSGVASAERATISRIIKATCTVNAAASAIAVGDEGTFVCPIDCAAGDSAMASPPINPGTGIHWSVFTTSGAININIANLAASGSYTTNSNWHIVLFRYA
jgi:hypothetical protein